MKDKIEALDKHSERLNGIMDQLYKFSSEINAIGAYAYRGIVNINTSAVASEILELLDSMRMSTGAIQELTEEIKAEIEEKGE